MKIYLACALTHVPRENFKDYASFMHSLARSLEADGNSVKYALINSDPQLETKPFNERAKLCYLWDAKMVHEADVVIAECSFPSIGLGMEMQLAVEEEIPTIVIFREYENNRAAPVNYMNPDHTEHDLQIGDGIVSLMALGSPSVFKVHKYLASADGIDKVRDSINILRRESSS